MTVTNVNAPHCTARKQILNSFESEQSEQIQCVSVANTDYERDTTKGLFETNSKKQGYFERSEKVPCFFCGGFWRGGIGM